MSIAAKEPTEIDRNVGLRIAALRKAKGISQTVLGQSVGVTFQQVQKYEKGMNRVGAGRMQEIAKVLEVPISALYGVGEDDAATETLSLLAQPGVTEVLNAYLSVKDPEVRRSVLAAMRNIVQAVNTAEAAGSA